MHMQFIEFVPTREQFEITGEAEWRHAKFATAPEQVWRFEKPSPTRHRFSFDAPIALMFRYQIECWRQSYSIPELFGGEFISFLHVVDGADRWLFGRNLFFRQVQVAEAANELP